MTTLLKARTEIRRESYDFYGLPVYVINNQEYATALGDEQAEQAAREFAKDCLDSVEVSLILKHSNLPHKVTPLLRYMQEGCGLEVENELLKSIIDDLDAFIKEAVEFHGRAYFLGFFSNQLELSLTQFPESISAFILADSEASDPQQVYLYRLG